MPEPFYPRAIECLLPIIDGWTPISGSDLEMYQSVLRRLEDVLGAGPTNNVKSQWGPKSGNASLAARLDAFLDAGGGLHDIAFVTGTERLGAFSEQFNGAFISFGGKTLSRAAEGFDGYHVLFSVKTPSFEDVQGQTYQIPSRDVPALWWTRSKLATGVWIQGRTVDGRIIDRSDSTAIEFALLAFGYESFVTG